MSIDRNHLTISPLLPKKAIVRSSPWRQSIKRLRKNKLAVSGLFILLVTILLCLAGPLFASSTANRVTASLINKPPSLAHWLGTDNVGRDVFVRLLQGGRISIMVGVLSMLSTILVGTVIGLLAGFYGGWVDQLITRLADVFLALPGIPILIIFGAIFSDLKVPAGLRIYFIILLISLMAWPTLALLIRGQILSFKERAFMLATETLGLRNRRKLYHLVLNVTPTIVVIATLTVAKAILSETVLSFLGLGVIPPTPSWGNMLTSANSLIDFRLRPWLWIPPGAAIFITVLSINFLGEGLRDILDPKLKGR
ncbi:peptide ABC transporter permease [Paenibacillus marchantiophytorum]|uniref:Peptide ABC transporter permease n=1 Tax=Paenibacillus marchantiophytorum TaxID=1619310 RepID=A0ABQ1F3W5_9BACL|nr:ABC transporter permease [Paenibacillus marchantiophytorum]GFZ98420.1 peptide ABC transporter permease [Paenibacillus marchantiophytorum]